MLLIMYLFCVCVYVCVCMCVCVCVCVCVCIISICTFVAMEYFFPYISVYFVGTKPSILGKLTWRYLSLQIDCMCLSVPVYSTIYSLPVVIIRHIV